MSQKKLPHQIVVVAAIIDDKTMTLYDDTGQTFILSTDEYRTKEIMDEIIPQIVLKKRATITLGKYTTHAEFEEKTKGLVKFFRVAKEAVAGIFDKTAQTISISDVMKAGEGRVVKDEIDEDETIVAVVGGKAIPNMEKIQKQFARSNSASSQKGMVLFLERLSKIIDQRGHSVEDLLKFLEKADLPIAEDGTVVAYKSLKTKYGSDPNVFYDIHSGNVPQTVGSYVYMDNKSVDPSRRADCSHGLHIARRDYISQFGGDVMVICKIPPENFIAVPMYSPSKVRVSGYHIVAQVNEKGHQLLKSNRPMSQDAASSKLLAEVIAGKHTPIKERVFIGGPRGTLIEIKPIKGSKLLKNIERAKTKKPEEKKAAALDDVKRVNSETMKPKAVNKRLDEIKEKAKTDSMTDDQKKAFKLIAEGYSKTQVANDVGTSTRTLGRWMDKFDIKMPDYEATPDEVTIVDGSLESDAEFLEEVTAPKASPKPESKHVKEMKAAKRTNVEIARDMYRRNDYKALVEFKKLKKKSWAALGFNQSEEKNLLNWVAMQK